MTCLHALSPRESGLAAKEPEELAERVSRMEAALLEQNGLLRELVAMLGNQRITRTQESAIRKGIRARAGEIRIREGLPESADRMIAGEIRKTIRETTGCRAVGDIPVRVFERTLALISAWNMAGAIRRIRRELNG